MKESASAITTASSDTAADSVVPVTVIVLVLVIIISVLIVTTVVFAVIVRVFASQKCGERLTLTCCTQAPGIIDAIVHGWKKTSYLRKSFCVF